MGAWISLNLFKYYKKQIKGFLGIGSAPDFLEKLMWKKFSKKMKKEIKIKGKINLKHGKYEYPITFQLIKDGRKNKVLNKKIYSRKVLKIFKNAKRKLIIIQNGDHSLSNSKGLRVLKKELSLILN